MCQDDERGVRDGELRSGSGSASEVDMRTRRFRLADLTSGMSNSQSLAYQTGPAYRFSRVATRGSNRHWRATMVPRWCWVVCQGTVGAYSAKHEVYLELVVSLRVSAQQIPWASSWSMISKARCCPPSRLLRLQL